MLWKARILIGIVWIGLSRFLPGRPTQGVRRGDSLRWIVHPKREDMFGYLEAALICRCVARSAARDWGADRLEAVAAKVSLHADAVRRYASRPIRLHVERMLDGNTADYPIPSDDLQRDLHDLAPYIAACEDRIGSEGVEF